MEPIDVSHERYKTLAKDVSGYISAGDTEADTRLKVINRVLTEVLLWPFSELNAEAPSDTGFVDYACTVDTRSRLMVEAKRDGRSLGCEDRQGGRAYKLSGGLFRTEAVREGIAQAIRYCGEKNAELACVTNGREWLIFRGTRLGDGIDTRDGFAFVFPSLISISDNFPLFYNLLSYESASKFAYRPYFQEAEGQPIRMSVFHKSLRPVGSARFQSGGELASDIEKVMSAFFRRLSGDQDPDLLEACFVETNESSHADGQLARIAESIINRVQTLETGHADSLKSLIERAKDTRRREFVLIVGTKGSGKSTFVTRFFRSVLPPDLSSKCLVLRVDLGGSPGSPESIARWLDSALVKEAELTLFDGAPRYNELEGMFYDEYTRLRKGPWAALYESDKTQFRIRFGDHVERMRDERPHDYIEGVVRHLVNNRKLLPVVIFDNADHFDIAFQQQVYQYARSIYEAAICLVILPITDRTSWQLSKYGALQSFDHEAFFLPTPSADRIIRKRIEFIDARIEAEKTQASASYFLTKGISLSIRDLGAFTHALQRIFLETSHASTWIGNLANHDVRRALNLARAFVVSPHLKVHDLLKAYIAGSAVDVPQHRAAMAVIRGKYDIYPVGQHDFVQNVFALNEDLATSPLLGVRLLQLLSDVPVREHEGALIQVDEVIAYFAGMNIDTRAVHLWLDAMLKTGLLLNYDPTVQEITHARQIEIAPSGRQHFFWATGNYEYISAMADVTPLLAEALFVRMKEAVIGEGWRGKASVFVEYLTAEDSMYCLVPDHLAYQSQTRLRSTLDLLARRLADSAIRRPARR